MIATMQCFLTALECTIFVFGRCSAWTPLGELTAIPRLPNWFNLTSKKTGRGGTWERERGRERKGPPSQIHGSTPVDVAVYTAVVLVTGCISLLPARPYFSAEYEKWRAMTGSADNVTIYFKYCCRIYITQTWTYTPILTIRRAGLRTWWALGHWPPVGPISGRSFARKKGKQCLECSVLSRPRS